MHDQLKPPKKPPQEFGNKKPRNWELRKRAPYMSPDAENIENGRDEAHVPKALLAVHFHRTWPSK